MLSTVGCEATRAVQALTEGQAFLFVTRSFGTAQINRLCLECQGRQCGQREVY